MKTFNHAMLNRSRKNRGFTLVEVMITLAIFGAALAVVLYYQQRAAVISKSTETTRALTSVVSKIKQYYGDSSDYTNLAAANLATLALAPNPLRINTTDSTILDPWGNVMTFTGGASGFMIELGGTSDIDVEACAAIAAAFSSSAKDIAIGTAQTYTAATNTLAGGSAYKSNGGAPVAANLTTGCSTDDRKISLVFN
jgi:prepilin-type N-terminal cleavage/methylation domain-containing protein